MEPGSARYASAGALLATHLDLGALSFHLAPPTVLPLCGYMNELLAGLTTMGELWVVDVAPEVELPKDRRRWGPTSPKGEMRSSLCPPLPPSLPSFLPGEMKAPSHPFPALPPSLPPSALSAQVALTYLLTYLLT